MKADIIIVTNRQELESCRNYFFQYIDMRKKTRFISVASQSIYSEALLSILAENTLFDEVERLVEQKLKTDFRGFTKLKLSMANAIALLSAIMQIPIDERQVYLSKIRAGWIVQLDSQFCRARIYAPVFTGREESTTDEIIEAEFYEDY